MRGLNLYSACIIYPLIVIGKGNPNSRLFRWFVQHPSGELEKGTGHRNAWAAYKEALEIKERDL